MEIKKGDRFRCSMNIVDAKSRTVFHGGVTYESERDGYITNSLGEQMEGVSILPYIDCFKKNNEPAIDPINRDSYQAIAPIVSGLVNYLCTISFNASKAAGWHTDIETGQLLERNKAEMLCLIHSEISEAMEGERKDLMDDKLPHRKMAEVELADAVIRICDYAGRWGYDLGGAIIEKMGYNANRSDHKIENRKKENGKKF